MNADTETLTDEPTAALKPVAEILRGSLAGLPSPAEQSARRAAFAAAEHQRAVAALRAHWQAPARHVQCQPQRIGPWGAALDRLTARQQSGRGLMAALVGTRGNGKTQLAVELMKLTTARRQSARFTTAVGFFIKVKATFRREAAASEEEVMLEFLRPHLLVIDEFEKRADTVWENNLVFELLNRRYNALKDTVLIANDTKSQFDAYVGDSVVSRINETGGVLECTWTSFR